MSTPRTDAAANSGGYQLLNVATESRTLELELQQAQAALAAVTLERDEAKSQLKEMRDVLRDAASILTDLNHDYRDGWSDTTGSEVDRIGKELNAALRKQGENKTSARRYIHRGTDKKGALAP